MKNKTVFVDVDTQFDFMNPGGSLYVPGAEDIIDNIRTFFNYAREHKIRVLSSIDAHKTDDPEFQTFPPHCVKDTPGNKKIQASTCKDHVIFENVEQDITDVILDNQQIIVEKQTFNIFDNVNTDEIITKLNAKNFVVFGVATEYCVKVVTLGLLKRGYNVSLVTDAIKAITEEGERDALREMQDAGVVFTTTEEILD